VAARRPGRADRRGYDRGGVPGEPAVKRRGEERMVPRVEFRSYYGQPVIKPPAWKSPDVPAYFFLGGLAGASATMAALAELTGRPRLAFAGYLTAGAGAAAGTGALIHDLGRPARFLNMLRMIKLTSPLSVGSWLLAGFSTLAGAAAASTVTGLLPGPAKAAKAGAAVLGPAMMTYPAVLVADTAVPAWHEAHRELPFVFAGAGLASGGALGMLAAPPVEAGPARAMAVVGSALELAGETALRRHGLVAEPYHRGRAGRWFRAGRLLTAAGAVGTLLAGGHRRGAAACGLALLAGSLCTRFAVFEAGRTSARDPKYTVVPQRERLSGQS